MPISTHPNSLLDARWASATELTAILGRPPTRTELSHLWNTTEPQAHAILRTFCSRGVEIPITLKAPSPAHANKRPARIAQIEQLTKTCGRPPTRKELSKLWGVNRSRVGRILQQMNHH